MLHVKEIIDFTSDDAGRTSAWTEDAANGWARVPRRPIDDGRFWVPHPLLSFREGELTGISFALPERKSIVNLSAVGDIALPEERDWWIDSGVSVTENCASKHLVKAQVSGNSVIEATGHLDEDYAVSGGLMCETATLLWIADTEDSFDDAVMFWNFRAMRPKTYQLGLSILTTSDVLVEEDVLRPVFESTLRKSAGKPDVLLASLSLNNERLTEIGESYGLAQYADTRFTHQIAGPLPDLGRQLGFVVNLSPASMWSGRRSIGPSRVEPAILQAPTTRMLVASPMKWNNAVIAQGKVVLSLAAPEFHVPPRKRVAELFHRHATWQNDSEGTLCLLTTPLQQYDLSLSIPTRARVLEAATAELGVQYNISDKAQQIHGIIRSADDLGIFRRRATLAAIQCLTVEPGRQFVSAVNEMRSRNLLNESGVRQLLEEWSVARTVARTLDEITSDPICTNARIYRSKIIASLEQLVYFGLVIRGHRVDCDVCSLCDFQDAGAAGSKPVCLGCGSDARFFTTPHGEPRFLYKLNTLLHRVSLNGGLAPLAATALLVEEGSFVVPGARISRSDQDLGDLDILGWCGSKVFSGEAKTSSSAFLRQNLTRDADKSVAVGSDVHLIVCLEPLSETVRASIDELCTDRQMESRYLTGVELLID